MTSGGSRGVRAPTRSVRPSERPSATITDYCCGRQQRRWCRRSLCAAATSTRSCRRLGGGGAEGGGGRSAKPPTSGPSACHPGGVTGCVSTCMFNTWFFSVKVREHRYLHDQQSGGAGRAFSYGPGPWRSPYRKARGRRRIPELPGSPSEVTRPPPDRSSTGAVLPAVGVSLAAPWGIPLP